jgi:UDP-N-acetylmuramate--alanine ligase
MVVEADESDGSFLRLPAVIAVVTNMDPEHLDHWGSAEAMVAGYDQFVANIPFYGFAVLCIDHPGVQQMIPRLSDHRIITYGFSPQADIRADRVVPDKLGSTFEVTVTDRLRNRPRRMGPFRLPMLGAHNVQNALAAIAVADELGVSDDAIVGALAAFRGVGRRFQRWGELPVPAARGGGRFTLVDDYGHHPAEMAATIAAARGAFPGRRLVLAFQPHRYTRTRDLFEDFVKVLSSVDALLLAEVYAAGESPIVAADGRTLARAVRVVGKVEPVFVEDVGTMPEAILDAVRDGDVVVTMGAGSIGGVPARTKERADV